MSENSLPGRGDSEDHYESLSHLKERFKSEQEPIHYKKIAIEQDHTTVSTQMKFFFNVGLVEREKEGQKVFYKPTSSLMDYMSKVGKSKQEAKEKLVTELGEDKIFSEISYVLNSSSYKVEKLAEVVAGQQGIDKEDIPKIEKYVRILEELELVEITEEEEVKPKFEANKDFEEESQERPEESNENMAENKKIATQTVNTRSNVSIEIQMDITEMEQEEIASKLESLNAALSD